MVLVALRSPQIRAPPNVIATLIRRHFKRRPGATCGRNTKLDEQRYITAWDIAAIDQSTVTNTEIDVTLKNAIISNPPAPRVFNTFFRGCFTPPGCYTPFPGVFLTDGALRIFPGGVSHRRGVTHFFRWCFTLFSGVFHTLFRGVLRIFPGCFALFPGVFHTFFGGVTHFFRWCFAPARCTIGLPPMRNTRGSGQHRWAVVVTRGLRQSFPRTSEQASVLFSATQVKKRHRRQRDSTPSWIERRRTREFPTRTLDCPVRERQVQFGGIVASAFVGDVFPLSSTLRAGRFHS
jgi:hypothetical protein